MSQAVITAEERALARAVVYRFLCAALRYPDREATEVLRSTRPAVGEALQVLGDATGEPGARFAELDACTDGWDTEAREDVHIQAFGHAPDGPCPPYEGQYGDHEDSLQMPHELSDLGAFYAAFGVKLATRARERVDSVAVECEYLSFLCQKSAYGEAQADAELVRLTWDGQRTFFRDHLGRWAPAFSRRLMSRIPSGFHHHLGAFLVAFLAADAARMEVPLGSDHLRLRVAVEERDACFDCPEQVQPGTKPSVDAAAQFPV
jgi:TorA maturation chaperone TorD